MLGQSIFSGYFSLAIIVLCLRHVLKSSGIQILLGGLHSYYCVDPANNPSTRLRPEDLKTKKGRKAYVKQQIQMAGASEQIYRQTLSPRSLQSLLFADDINTMVTIGLSVVLNAVLVICLSALIGVQTTIMTIGITMLLVVFTIYVLIKVDYAAEARTSVDHFVMGVVMVVGTGAALAALLVAPEYTLRAGRDGPVVPMLEFDVESAAQGFDQLVLGVQQRVAERLKQDLPAIKPTNPLYVAIATSVWAGMISVAMMGPAMHYSRLLYRCMNVPGWGTSYMTHSKGVTKLMQLGFILPMLVAASQVPALTAFWGMDPSHAQLVLGVLLILLAIIHYFTIAPMSQTYLDGGLLEWHTLLHNGINFEGKMGVVRVRLDLLRSLLGKACVQLVSPPLLASSMGLLLLLHCGVTEQVSARMAGPREALISRLPPSLTSTLAHLIKTPSSRITPNTTISITSSGATATLQGSYNAFDGPGMSAGADPVAVTATGLAGAPEDEPVALIGLTEDGSTVSVTTTEGKADKGVDKGREEAGAELNGPQGTPTNLWRFLAQFWGWWTCLTWTVYACSSMTVYRLGLNSG